MKTLQELLTLKEEAEKTVDLETFTGKSIPHQAWPDGVTYKGLNVYKTIYDGGEAEHQIHDAINEVKEDFESEKDDGRFDMQESYLGYSPSRDLFIQGYDGWMEHTEESYQHDEDDEDDDGTEEVRENCSPYVIFRLKEDGTIKVQDKGADYGNNQAIWYGGSMHSKGRTPGGLAAAHKNFSDLIDIRLD